MTAHQVLRAIQKVSGNHYDAATANMLSDIVKTAFEIEAEDLKEEQADHAAAMEDASH